MSYHAMIQVFYALSIRRRFVLLRAWNTLSESAGNRLIAFIIAGLLLGLQNIGFNFSYSKSFIRTFSYMYLHITRAALFTWTNGGWAKLMGRTWALPEAHPRGRRVGFPFSEACVHPVSHASQDMYFDKRINSSCPS